MFDASFLYSSSSEKQLKVLARFCGCKLNWNIFNINIKHTNIQKKLTPSITSTNLHPPTETTTHILALKLTLKHAHKLTLKHAHKLTLKHAHKLIKHVHILTLKHVLKLTLKHVHKLALNVHKLTLTKAHTNSR